ncbi:hypothetical protein HanPI659440_Chr14g0555721 [Helianthus annuus]|nr:hypothetical protein HanPI659440_Chr14g0555721 [Helianthus annuus]
MNSDFITFFFHCIFFAEIVIKVLVQLDVELLEPLIILCACNLQLFIFLFIVVYLQRHVCFFRNTYLQMMVHKSLNFIRTHITQSNA